jgi:Kef-type K+ transport system membrane component KefB
MTTDQVLLGVGLILALAVGSQVVASRLRIPALIILLPAGFVAGALTTDVDHQQLVGAAYRPLGSDEPDHEVAPRPEDGLVVLSDNRVVAPA